MAGLGTALPGIRARGGDVVVVGCGRPEDTGSVRDTTGYAGSLLTDPSLETFRAAGLAYGLGRTVHPRSVLRGLRAFARGFRQGRQRGNPLQQGGTFVLGPGPRVRMEWRDRFAGDHPDMADVLAALGAQTVRDDGRA